MTKLISKFSGFTDFDRQFVLALDDAFDTLSRDFKPYAVANNYHFTDADQIDSLQVNATAGNLTVTLPTPNGNRRRRVIKTDVSVNTVTLTASPLLINGATTFVLTAQYKYVWVEPTGAGWLIIGSN